jgi:hypothetical protein
LIVDEARRLAESRRLPGDTDGLRRLEPNSRHPRLTNCTAVTHTQLAVGIALFKGTCNGSKSSLKVVSHKITGRIGGLFATFERNGATLSGRLGGRNARLVFQGRTFKGHYGPHSVKFFVRDRFTVGGHVGTMKVACSVTPLSPLGERITCKGRRGGAGVLAPYLAQLYAAP